MLSRVVRRRGAVWAVAARVSPSRRATAREVQRPTTTLYPRLSRPGGNRRVGAAMPWCSIGDLVNPPNNRRTEPRPGVRAHDQPSLCVPPVPQRARLDRHRDHLVAATCRAVPPERGSDPQGSGLFRGVRCARRRLLCQGASAPPTPDPRARPAASGRDHRRRQPRAGHSPTTRGFARRASRSRRCLTPPTRRSATSRAAACRSTTSRN